MNCAVISDVHGNEEALQAVLQDIKQRKIRNILFLGDAVGYGPNPNECVKLLKDNCREMISGNHDYAVLGLTDISNFNDYAKAAVEWTSSVMKKKYLSFLRFLPLVKLLEKDDTLLVHSTPKEPDKWHYILTGWDAEVNFRHFEQKTCLIGHSHQAVIIEDPISDEMLTHKNSVEITEAKRYIINVGSVGQPRDGDPRACYAIITNEKVELIRVKYDISKTQKKMLDAGLPLPLIQRLERGT